MPKQKGPMRIQGTVGDITFYKSTDGFLLRDKGGISADAIANSPKFERTRRAMSEFGTSGKLSKLVRQGFAMLLKGTADPRMFGRLQGLMVSITKSDSTNGFGDRRPEFGDLIRLKNFDFNKFGPMKERFYGTFSSTIDTNAGTAVIVVDSFVPTNGMVIPKDATHYQIIKGVSELKIVEEDTAGEVFESGYLPINGVATAPVTTTLNFTAGTTNPVITVLGIKFWQDLNGIKTKFPSNEHNPLAIIDIVY